VSVPSAIRLDALDLVFQGPRGFEGDRRSRSKQHWKTGPSLRAALARQIGSLPEASIGVQVIGIITMILLFFGELSLYLSTVTEHELLVDTTRGEKLLINMNMTFHRLPCSVISLDTMDISGEQHLDVSHEVEIPRENA